MKRKHRRLAFLVAGMVALAGVATLVLSAFEENLLFFYSPTDVVEDGVPTGRTFRLGGLVEENSVRRVGDGLTVEFQVTDLSHAIRVSYKGILPDLFGEGQGVVAEGRLTPAGVFVATRVLAKHDESYMPPEVAEALKKSGQWRGPSSP
ncbi:MAG: cytochrome c maturation protein CcmE [Alphaproteobacteria bacterium]